jgi:ABC-type Fe3+/spermidine/putrescine transport system ATPase subunit
VSLALRVDDLTVRLDGSEILRGLSLDLEAGAYGVILGPSGAGKSTLLRAIAGLLPATGIIRLGETDLCAGSQLVPAEQRPLGYLFQGLALWPHMTVQGHLDFALSGRSVPKPDRPGRIEETLLALGLAGKEGRRPAALSGGERQRLALARALVTRPGLLLLDEPTSSVDPRTAQEIHDLLARVNRTFGATVLHVTHDQAEALALADKVCVLHEGTIVQSGTPEEIYDRPGNRLTADFVGAGGLLPGVIRNPGSADTPLGSVPVESGADGLDRADPVTGPVWLLARPQDLTVVPAGDGVPVEVTRTTYKGGCWQATVSVGEHSLKVDLEHPAGTGECLRIKVGRSLWVVGTRVS